MGLVVLIDQPDFTVASESRLIKKQDAVAIAQAAKVVRRAKRYWRETREETARCLEQERERGYRQGVLDAQAEWTERLAAAAAARHWALEDLAPTLVGIVTEAVSVIVRNADPQQLLASALASVSDLIKQVRWVRLRVHVEQADAARVMLDDFARQSGRGVDWVSVVADASVAPDTCVFETDVGIADASASVQLDVVRGAVQSAVSQLLDAARGRAA